MNPTAHRLDAYFSGQTSPAEERTLAQELASDPALADQFVEQARLDALLGEIFTDQRAGKFHESLVAKLMTVEQLKPATKTPAKVIHGPFPYWKQVAAVVALGLFLWGISSVWYGASQLADANPRRKPAPRIASVETPAITAAEKTLTAAEDRDLETWLRKYFVGAQPFMERSLEDWLIALVEKEFPQHNHLNKHRNLTWEIRATTPEVQEKLARQNVRLQCSPGSLMDQVRGLAALAGCDVQVERERLVLTPMKESSSSLESREITLSDAFVNGETVVNSGPITQQANTWEWLASSMTQDAQDAGIDRFIIPAESPNSIPLATTRILQSGIDWPKGAEITGVTPIQHQTAAIDLTDTITFTLPSSEPGGNSLEYETFSITTTTPAGARNEDYLDTNLHFLTDFSMTQAVMTSAYQINLRTSPRGFHQLEILNQLPKPATAEPKLTITNYTFPANQAPRAKDRVLAGAELNAVADAYRNSALSVVPVDRLPENGALRMPVLSLNSFTSSVPGSWQELPVLQTTESGATFNFTNQTEPLPQVAGASSFPVTPNIPTNWSFRAIPRPTSQANLTLTRSGELLKISGAINLLASAPSVVFDTQPAPIEILTEYAMEDVPAEAVSLGDESPDISIDAKFVESENPVVDPTPQPAAVAGVDISLSLFPGQGAIVTGPTVDGQVHYYLLKLAE